MNRKFTFLEDIKKEIKDNSFQLSIIIIISLILIFPYILHPNLGWDTPVHLARSKYLSENFPSVKWNYGWGFGVPFNLYPPMTYFLVDSFAYFLPLISAYTAIVILAFVLSPIAIYFLLKDWIGDKWFALLGSFLLLGSWVYLGSYYIRGQLPNNLGIFLIIIFFIAFNKFCRIIANKKETINYLITISFILTALMITHHLSLLPFILMFILYLIVNPYNVPLKILIRYSITIFIFSIGLSSFFLIPFINAVIHGRMSFASDPPIHVRQLIMNTDSFYQYANFLGYPLVVLSIIAIFILVYRVEKNDIKEDIKDNILILSFIWTFIFSILVGLPIKAGFQGVFLPHNRIIPFLNIVAVIISTFSLKYIIERLNKKGFNKSILIYIISLLTIISAVGGVVVMVKESPFYGYDDNAKKFSDYLSSHSTQDDIIIIPDNSMYEPYWLNFYNNVRISYPVEVYDRNINLLNLIERSNPSDLRALMTEIGARYALIPEKNASQYLSVGFIDLIALEGEHLMLLPNIQTDFVISNSNNISYKKNQDTIVINTISNENTNIIIRTNYNEGWKGNIDGNEIPLNISNYGFISIDSPSGEHKINLEYKPFDSYIGYIISLLSIIIISLYYIQYTNRTHPIFFLPIKKQV